MENVPKQNDVLNKKVTKSEALVAKKQTEKTDSVKSTAAKHSDELGVRGPKPGKG